MTLEQAMAQQPAWLGLWLNWLMFGAFALPLVLFIWRQTRIAAAATLITGILGGVSVSWMYDQMGYVKLLGLPHIILWTPLVIYLIALLRRGDLPKYASWVMLVVLGTLLVSLAFDYTDALRYFLGNKTPLAMPAG